MKTSNGHRAIVLALAVLIRTEAGRATVLTVAADGSGEHTTITGAVAAASSGDTIRIVVSPHTESAVVINKSLIIEGLGANQTVVQAHADRSAASNRVFYINTANTEVTFRDMTIRHGNLAGRGGCIAVAGSLDAGPTVTVERCTIARNDCTGGDAQGAGLNYDSPTAGGSLTVLDSTFADNVSSNSGPYQGGAAMCVGAIDALLIRNSTFSGNVAYKVGDWTYGGGLILIPDTGLVQNCTFVTNGIAGGSCGGGGVTANDLVTLESCVFAGNFCGHSGFGSAMAHVRYTNCTYEGTVYSSTDLGGNVATNNARVQMNLADNGGPTPTHALLAGSAAIGAGSNPAGLSHDQRGAGYDRQIGTAVDGGAFEYKAGPIRLSYSTNAFHEALPNTGSIANASPLIVTLSGNDAFTGANGPFDPSKVAVANLPDGLAASFQKTSDETLSVSLTGMALDHALGDSVTNLEFVFQDNAFAGGSASGVGNSSNGMLQVVFRDPADMALEYNTNAFFEAAANDGSVAAAPVVRITAFNTAFTGSGTGENFAASGKVLVSNLPAGLTAVVSRVDESRLTATLTGNATSHNSASNVADLTFAFQDAAFENGGAYSVSNATNASLTISFADPVLTYRGSGAFSEAPANDGSIGTSFTIGLVGDVFSGTNGQNFAGSEVAVSPPPGGLAWSVIRNSATNLTVSFTGNAAAQNAADSVNGMTLTFQNAAFVNSAAAVVANGSKTDYSIAFTNPTLTYSGVTFYESEANDGTVPDTATITLAGDTFTGGAGDNFAGDEVSVANVPFGLTARLERASPSMLKVSFTGAASSHNAAANKTNVTFAFQSTAFHISGAAIVTNSTKANLSVLFREAYYVNQLIGSDANDGTANDAAHAWATLTNAAARAPANSIVCIMASPHTEKDITVPKAMLFKGQGARKTAVQANPAPWIGTGRVFNVTAPSGSVGFEDMTLRNGRVTGDSAAGGAILGGAAGGAIQIVRCSFEQNESEGYGGGAVRSAGPSLTVRDSTFRQNIAIHNVTGNGACGGAIYASGASDITIANSTFSENQAQGAFGWQGGGGALCVTPSAGYAAGIYNCTFYSNAVPTGNGQGGAIRGGSRDATTVYSCVFARNTINGSSADTLKGSSMSECGITNCVYEDAYVTAYPTTYNLGGNIGTNNAGLDPVLANNGGPTLTHALLKDSVAINAGVNPLGLGSDQRGRLFDRVHGAAADAGAFEFGSGAPKGSTLVVR